MPLPTPTDPWPLPELTRARRAILVVDVVESVRLMQEDEAGFIDRWRRFVHEVRSEVLPAHGGRMVKSLGDGMLLEFPSGRPAVAAALAMQALMQGRAASGEARRALPLRTGIHAAEVVLDELDVYGAGVNLAARLASLAGPDQIVVSSEVCDEIVPGLDADVVDLGQCWLKHVEASVHAFRLGPVRAPAGTAVQAPAVQTAAEGTASELNLTLAVLPLGCDQGSLTDALLGDFVADGVIASLSMTPNLRVLSRLTTRAAAVRGLSVEQIAVHLHANYVLSGSYVVNADQVLADAELADTRSGHVVASWRQASTRAQLFEHPSEPIEALASTVHHAILQAEAQRARSQPLPNIEGYALLAGSVGLIHRVTSQDFLRAREALEALIYRVPRHGSGYAWLAKWHFLRMIRGLAESPLREREEARQRIEQALERDPCSAMAWALRGLLHAWVDHDLERAERAYDSALANNPSEALAWLYMNTLRSWQGRGAEAATCAERALALTPLDPMRYYFESLAAAGMLAAGRHDEAIALCESSLRVNGAHTPTHRVLTIAQVLSGRAADAATTMARMREIEPKLTVGEYLGRYPGAAAPHAHTYADALRSAGLPD